MGLFSRKPSLSAEELLARMNDIDSKICDQNYQEAFADATALEKEAHGYGSYHLGMLYHLGWGVEQNPDRALSYYENALSIDNDFVKFVRYMGGLLLLNIKSDYEQAAEWLEKAEDLGEEDASLYLACAWMNLAMEYRGYACRTLKMNELTQANAVATSYAIKAQNKYLEVAQRAPESIPYDHWCCLGRCAQMLYNLACRGELSMDIATDNSFSTWLGNSFSMVGGTMNQELHDKMLRNAAVVCDAMDRGGRPLIGEYFRALCGLLDSELHHSAEAFYRVRWHMKRIGELRKSDEDAGNIADLLSDLDDSFSKMQKKYDRLVFGMMREKRLPDLTPSYLEGQAPAPESCPNFMAMFEDAGNAPPPSDAPAQKEKKGLFGFFKR